MKYLQESVYKKDESIKRLNEKIIREKTILRTYDEENKKICNRIHTEEIEGEKLRHILNFLLSQRD